MTQIAADHNPPASPSEALIRASDVADRCAERAADIDHDGAFPSDEFGWIADAGLHAAPLPRALGGLGLGTEPDQTAAALHLLKHLGRGNLSVGRLYEGHVNALLLVARYGTTAQRERWAEDARSGKLFGVWNTEMGDGVSFEPSKNGYEIQGAKTFASGAGHVERPVITGALPGDHGGWQMAVLPADEVSVAVDKSWWKPVGMKASASYKIDFTGTEITEDALLGPPSAYHEEPWFSGGAIRFAAVQLGGAEAVLETVRQHLQQRERTEDAHQRRRAGQMAVGIESGAALLNRAARLADRCLEDDAPENAGEQFVAHANLTRTAIERICLDVLERAERSVGAAGMLAPHPLERLMRDLRTYLRQPVPDAALDDAGRYALDSTRPVHQLWLADT